MTKQDEPTLKACGFLIVRGSPVESFLLMRHADRWDLPKGHMEPGETEMECALRELEEETGIQPDDIEIVPGFRFTIRYTVQSLRTGHQPREKTVVIFLARLLTDIDLQPTEHLGGEWFPWAPPHRIQQRTIDPLLAEAEAFLTGAG
ncbi:MAG: NUDIX domain-containing protein [Pirellulales bacterium]